MPRWLTAALVAFLAGTALLLAWGAEGGLRGHCRETTVDSLSSPDGTWQVRAFHADCGRARGMTTRIALRRAGDPWTKSDRGTTDSGLVLMFADRMPVSLGWVGDTLWMSCTGCTKAPVFWKRADGRPFPLRVFDSSGTALKAP